MTNSWRWGRVTELLSSDWLGYLEHFDRLLVGFSGGLDSTVLLHVLVQQPLLAKKILAIHINHGLNRNAQHWEQHCQDVCNHLAIPLIIKRVDFDRHSNIEANARKARYAFFQTLLVTNNALITGHHRDDQAETLLLQLCRGAGVDGLAAMPLIKPFAQGTLIRPLLAHSRESLECYAKAYTLSWIEDESNHHSDFSRNFLRNEVLPLLKKRWPSVSKNIARTASHCQEVKLNLEALARSDYPNLDQAGKTLSLDLIRRLDDARVKNILRSWLKINQMPLPDSGMCDRIIHELIFANGESVPEIVCSDYQLRRYQQTLYLVREKEVKAPIARDWACFPEALVLPEQSVILAVEKAETGFVVPSNACIQVRYRQGGETFLFRGQKKSLKTLFQEWKIPPWLRHRIPLVYCNKELAVVVGYAISDAYYQRSAHCYQIIRHCES